MRLDPLVTNVYAEALFATAKKRGAAIPLTEQAQNIVEILDREARLQRFFDAPHLSTESKLDLAEKLFRPRLLPLLADFVLYLIRKGRIEYLRDILERLQELVQLDQGISPATLTTAKDLSPAEKLRLKTTLERFTGKQLKVVHKVDATILGGVIFSAQDTYIDNSIRGHLKRLREQLQRVAVH